MKTILDSLIDVKLIKSNDIKQVENCIILDDQFFLREINNNIELYILYTTDLKQRVASSSKLNLFISHMVSEGLIKKLSFPSFSGEVIDNLIDKKLSLVSKNSLSYKNFVVLILS